MGTELLKEMETTIDIRSRVHVYVANPTRLSSPFGHAEWSSVVMLELSDLAIAGTARLAPDALRLAMSPDKTRLWVSHHYPGLISVLDAESLKLLCMIKAGTGTEPEGFAVRPASRSIADHHAENQVFVALKEAGKVAVYNMDTNELIRTLAVTAERPSQIAVTQDGRKAYVTSDQPAQVSVLDCVSGRQLAMHDFGAPPNRLQEIVISPDGATVYIADQSPTGQIEMIRARDDTVLEPIPTAPYPRSLGISPDGAYMFIGHMHRVDSSTGEELPGEVRMMRLSDYAVVASVEVPSCPRTIAVAPTGRRIFVAEHESNQCYAFDIVGESMSLAAVADLEVEPGYSPMPVHVLVG